MERRLFMTETRAIARLPQLEIEIRHRQAAEEGAEYLSINLRATPGFQAAAQMLDPFRLVQSWAMLNPFLFWGSLLTSASRPARPTLPEAREAPAEGR
jgi:hypothetical protein